MRLLRRQFLEASAASLAALAVAPAAGRAQTLPVELRLSARELAAGDRTTLGAELLVRAARIGPVMLTPTAEGTAIEVVRGRLTGEDGEAFVAADGRHGLRFAIPVAAHMPGTSVVRVRANLYGCDATCEVLETSASLTVRVQRSRG